MCHWTVTLLEASPNGSRIAVLDVPGRGKGVCLLNADTGTVAVELIDKSHGPLSVAYSDDGRTVAVGYAPYGIILWNAETGNFIRLLEGHSNWVVSLAFSPDGTMLVSGCGDSTARVWDVKTGKEIGRFRFPRSNAYVDSVDFSSDGKLILAATSNRLVVAKVPSR